MAPASTPTGTVASVPVPVSDDEIRRAPKVLLHDHLDGGLRPTTVLELAEAIGVTEKLPATEPDELQAWFTRGAETGDILQYLATFEHTTAVLQSAEALERVAAEAVADLDADGVVYAETRFAPELHTAGGMALDDIVAAVTAGLRRGEHEAGGRIVVNTILCAMRTSPPERSRAIAELCVRARERGDDKVVGFDLAGAETGYPPRDHADALAYARAAQLRITIHASEPPDLELIDDALAHGAERIGHGVRLASDVRRAPDGQWQLGALARYVLDRQIPLELAPTCNVQIGAVPDLASHPIGPFLRLGFRVTANTDNRLMSHVSVSSEVAAVAGAHDFGWDEIGQLARSGIESAFAPRELIVRLRNDVIDPAYAALAGDP